MKCSTVQNITQEYLEGRLSSLDRNLFVSHVAECAECEEEVLAYREVFSGLREMKRENAPLRVRAEVLAHLRSTGVIRPQSSRVSTLDRFLSLPSAAKYPLAALTVIAALYVPLAAVLGLARGSIRPLTGAIADAYLTLQSALGSVSVLSAFVDELSPYGRAFRTVRNAVVATVTRGDNAWVLPIGFAAVFSVIFAFLVFRRKKSTHHATFGF